LDEQQAQPRIAIVGAGISGLSAAHRLTEIAPGCQVTLFEAGSRPGGVISTVHEQGYEVEQSADNFITTVPWGVSLCKRIGLGDELIGTNPTHRHTFVVRKGRLCRLPDGFLMMAPTRLWPLALTPILSPWGKMRAAMEYFIRPRKGHDDESMAAFARRRLGGEVFDRLIEPLVSAVYAADMEKLSLDATLSQFREMEVKYGSLIRAMRRRMAESKTKSTDSGARYSMFVTPRRGLSSMIDALVSRLPQGSLVCDAPIEHVSRTESGMWLLLGPAFPPQAFDRLILATPSHVAGRLLRAVDPQLAMALAKIEHSGTAILSVGYARSQVGHPLNGMGVVVPAVEHSPILACSFSSQKYPHRAPEGQVLLRIFAGGSRNPELAELDDARLCPLLLDELKRLLRITGEPAYMNVAHWPSTMPQYHVGHKHLVEHIEARVASLGTLQLAGNAYHGVGIPHCVHSGERAAQRIGEKGLGIGD
jgi:oxygen-dependent protoporphyrinogen oxidase